MRKLNFVNRWATHFLVNAEAVKQQVVRYEHFDPDRVAVIPNGMWDADHRRRMLDAGSANPPEGFPDTGPVVGITASLREVKRIDRFLEMAAKVLVAVPEARFVIAGQGHLNDTLHEQAQQLGIGEAVVFLGQVQDVPGLLGHLQVGVLTSESEGLSNSLVEYGLAGVPTVTFAVGGNAEVVQEDETGYLVAPGDTAAMAERVIRLLTDSDLRSTMSTAARKRCESVFAPERVRDLTLDYFNQLIDQAGGRR